MQRALLIILTCLALVAAGCGDDSSTSTSPSPAETSAEETSPAGEDKAADAEEATEEKAADETEKFPFPLPKVPDGPPPKELVVEDLKKGTGPTAKAGDEASVEYAGVVYESEELFDANWGSGEPFTFKLGSGKVIKGWEEGVQGMKVGGQRELIAPPAYAYGNEGVFPSIPPNSTLVFRVKLLRVK